MGQGSSQPMNGGLSEPENQERDAVGYSPSGPPKTSKEVRSEVQVEGTPAPKRKRKQIVNDANIGMSSAAPNQSQGLPSDQAGAPPVKRTKIAPSTGNTKEARKPERNGTREAIPSPETPVIANISKTGKVNGQSTDVQPLTDIPLTTGTTSKKPKKSKVKTTQQDEEKEVSALAQSPAETKTISVASANPSPADSSTDQRDLTETSGARGPRKGKKDKMIGFFAASEVRALETFKLHFCNEHGLSSNRFDRMVQHVDRRKDSSWPCDENVIKKPDFWQQIYDVLPSRDRRSVYRFMRRHFQDSSQKPHQWTHEQDDELIDLVGQYGPKFAHIAKMLGRVEDDVVQRWKNRLEHRSTMRRGAWSEEEVRGLLDALQDAWNKLRKDGQNVGRDIYEMDEGLISWGTVSNKLQNCRSRQQCADKWRKIRRKIMGQRSTGDQEAVYDPATEAKPQGRAKSITLAEQMEMERMLFKSSEYVDSEDGDEEDMEQSGGTQPQSPKKAPKQINKIIDESESAEEKPTIMAAPEKPATPAKALSKVSQSKESQTETDDDSKSEASSDSAQSASEAETQSGSGSGSGSDSDSDSDSESSVESNMEVNARMTGQSSKAEEKDVRNDKASSAKTSSKPTNPTPNQKRVESKPKTSDEQKPRGQATKAPTSDSSAKAEANPTPRAKAPKPSKSTTKEEEVPQATSSESESESESDSESASDTSSSSDSESESTSSSEEPSNKQPTEVAPKAPKSIEKASAKDQVSQETQNNNESEESSSTSDETSSGDDSTEDSETDDDSDSDSGSDSSASASNDKPVKSSKAAALEGTKRKAQEPAEQTEKSASKRLKTAQKPSKKSSSPSSSDTSSSEDRQSEDESNSNGGSHDSGSEADTDESSSASDSSDSSSKPQPQPQSKSKSQPKQPTAQPKVPKAATGQKLELSKSHAPAISKEGSNAKNGQSGPKQKSKQVKPSFPQVKKDGEREKGKLGSTPASKGKKSK